MGNSTLIAASGSDLPFTIVETSLPGVAEADADALVPALNKRPAGRDEMDMLGTCIASATFAAATAGAGVHAARDAGAGDVQAGRRFRSSR